MQKFTTQEQNDLNLIFTVISKTKSSKIKNLIAKIFKIK